MHKIVKRIVISVSILAVVLLTFFLAARYVLDSVLHDGHMHFPLAPSGEFAEQPHLVSDGDDRYVRWVLLPGCNNFEYQAVTSDYVEDKTYTAWFGGGDFKCEQSADGRTACQLLTRERMQPLLEQGHSLWFVVRGVCGSQSIVSQKLVISK